MSGWRQKEVNHLEIQYFNRQTQKLEIEKVYGEKAILWAYKRPLGKLLSPILTGSLLSRFYGMLQDLPSSKKKVRPFIKDFNIQVDDFIPSDGHSVDDPYPTFNDFFVRRFKEGKRPFDSDQKVFPAFSEARYFGYEQVHEDEKFPVKGKYLYPSHIIGNKKWQSTFKDGPLLLARLCPVDYHRFHYPDNGRVIDHYRIEGDLHSVNPLALKMKEDILIKNERQVTILETENFGKLAYVEVGAICVGKIVQTSDLTTFKRGEEKGMFLFGGSTVIVIGEKGKWKPSDEILDYTKKGIEVYSHLGQPLGLRIDSGQ